MKKLTILRGLSGSGKSTLARQMCQIAKLRDYSCIVCSADDFYQQEDGTYKFDPKQLPNAHAYSRGAADHAMMNDTNRVIIDNTNIQKWEYEPYLTMAKDYGYEVEIITVGDVEGEILAEYATRNEHGVTIDGITKQAKRWEK